MKLKSFILVAAVSSALFLDSCKKSSIGASSFKYKMATSNRINVVGKIESGNIAWTTGYGSANLVKFEAKNSSNAEVEYKTNTAQHIDLFSTLASVLGTINLPAGTYREIEFKAELAPSGSDAALELTGTFTSGAIVTPIVFTVNSAIEVKTERSNVVITDGASYSALANLNMAMLAQGITEAMLNSATRNGGKILISSSSNSGLYAMMLANLDNCDEVEFERD